MTTEKAVIHIRQLIEEYDARRPVSAGVKEVMFSYGDRAALQHALDQLRAPATPDPRIVAIRAALDGTGGPRSKLDAIEKIMEGVK